MLHAAAHARDAVLLHMLAFYSRLRGGIVGFPAQRALMVAVRYPNANTRTHLTNQPTNINLRT